MTASTERRKILFSHHPCIDGVACYLAMQEKFPDAKITCQGLNHMEQLNYWADRISPIKLTTDQIISTHLENLRMQSDEPLDIYFLDYVPNDEKIVRQILDQGHRVTIYDHHHKAGSVLWPVMEEEGLTGNIKFIFDGYSCGATITWNELHPDMPPPPLFNLIEKMDLLTLKSQQERFAAFYIDQQHLGADQDLNVETLRRLMREYEEEGLEGLASQGREKYEEWENLYSRWKTRNIKGESPKSCTISVPENEGSPDAIYQATLVPIQEIYGMPRSAFLDSLDAEHPVLMMVNQSEADQVVINVRVDPSISDQTTCILDAVLDMAKKVPDITDDERDRIAGGGRGIDGLIGQGACRMPPSVAAKLGIAFEMRNQAIAPSQRR